MKNPYSIAGHTMGTPEYDLTEAAEIFASIGLDGIEIIWDDEYKCALPKASSPDELRELKVRLDDLNLKPCCLTPYMTNIDSLEKTLRRKDVEDFLRCIETAAFLEVPLIRVYGGAYNPDSDVSRRSRLESYLLESLEIMGKAAGDADVVLAVETHFSTLTCSAAETAAIIKKADHPNVRVLYDQPNIEFSDGEDFPEALDLLEGMIAFVHVKDLVYKDGNFGEFKSSKVVTVDESERRISSRIPGDGIIPWPDILPALKAKGFSGWLSLEYERRWYPYDLPEAGVGMKKGFEYIRRLLEKI